MHTNPIYRQTDAARSLKFALDTVFGQLKVSTDPVPLVEHISFLVCEQTHEIELHLKRSNPIARILKKHQKLAKLSIVGPHRYISPDWYGVIDQVPTLHHVAAHISGTLRIGEREDLRALLDRLSAHFEDQLAPKPAWRTIKMTPDFLDKMLRQIIPCELKIEDIQSAWKLNQNKTDVV